MRVRIRQQLVAGSLHLRQILCPSPAVLQIPVIRSQPVINVNNVVQRGRLVIIRRIRVLIHQIASLRISALAKTAQITGSRLARINAHHTLTIDHERANLTATMG